jgi:hypothetical protein
MRPLFFYLGVFLISSSTLMLEIIQTRILSVVVWYHLDRFARSVFYLTDILHSSAVSLALGINATLIAGALCYLLLIPVSLALVLPIPVKSSKKQAR